ncbi:zinc finger, CCHC-type containing protein [Tanacetum coccineum]
MDFPEFYWGRFLLGVSLPLSQLKIPGRFGYHVHLGFHLLLIGLGASECPPCGCLGLPLVNSLVPVMAHETKHRNEQKLQHLEEALPKAPPATATVVVHNAYTRMVIEQQKIACIMLVIMTIEIQKNLEDRTTFDILHELKTMFQQQAEQELFETVNAFHDFKKEEGQSVSIYVLKMKAYLDQMERLGYPIPLVCETIPKLHALLKLAEKGIPKKAPTVLAIRQGHIHKPKPQARGKGNNKGKMSQAWTLEEELSSLFGRVEEEQSQHIWHISYALESAAHILNMVLTKKVEKMSYEIWHGKVPNLSYLKAEHDDVEPQTDVNPVHRSARIPQAPEWYGFYVDIEEHELGDHGEPTNYRAALSDPKSDKLLEAMNAEMQSMKDNQVWNLVDLPPNYNTVRRKWLFKKKTNMDGNIHTF